MNEVSKWLKSGAEIQEGLRLLSAYAPSRHLPELLRRNPGRFKGLLVSKLRPFADEEFRPEPGPSDRPRVSFREQWPFLSDPACPPELKILAADKITAWHNFTSAHERLFECTTPEDCYAVAKSLLENYRQNRQISAEFTYFRENGRILGKHPVFARSKKKESFEKMDVIELLQLERNLRTAIWRARSEMSKGTRPHLDSERIQRIQEKEWELKVVTELIDKHKSNR